jgi:DNA repair exonuclease SbcCD ATPase subunit
VFEYCSDDERKKISDTIQSASESVNNSERDEDEKRKANKQLKNLMVLLDDVEEEEKMPQLVKEYNSKVAELQKLINEYADPKQKDEFNKQLEDIKAEGEIAIKENNKTLLSRKNEELQNLGLKAAYSNPNTWINVFRQMVQAGNFTNEKDAQYYINKGTQAINAKDYEELKRCVMQLSLLLPVGQQKGIDLSGITR